MDKSRFLDIVYIGPGTSADFTHVALTNWLMVIGFVATVVPFYHGANRYLDATYVTGERGAKRFGLLIDFFMLFLEGTLFFVISLFVGDSRVFYSVLAGLLVFDGTWVLMSTYLWGARPGVSVSHASDAASMTPRYTLWMTVNFIAAGLIVLVTWSPIGPTDLIRNIGLTVIVMVRTVVDYSLVWDFYYPPELSVPSIHGIDS